MTSIKAKTDIFEVLRDLLEGLPTQDKLMREIDGHMADILKCYVQIFGKEAQKECRLLLLPFTMKFFAIKYGDDFLEGMEIPEMDEELMDELFQRIRVREIGYLIDDIDSDRFGQEEAIALFLRLRSGGFKKNNPYPGGYWFEGDTICSSNLRDGIILAIELGQDYTQLLKAGGYTSNNKCFEYKGIRGYVQNGKVLLGV
jgi:hypothetical protein